MGNGDRIGLNGGGTSQILSPKNMGNNIGTGHTDFKDFVYKKTTKNIYTLDSSQEAEITKDQHYFCCL